MTTSISSQPFFASIQALKFKESHPSEAEVSGVEKESLPAELVNKVDNELMQSLSMFKKANLAKEKSDAPFMTHMMLKNLTQLESSLERCNFRSNHDFVKELYTLKTELKDNPIVNKLDVSLSNKDDANISDQIGSVIEKLKEGYYDVFESAVAKYINFYKELSAIMSEMGKLIKKSDKEGFLCFDYKTLSGALNDLYNKYAKKDSSGYHLIQLYPLDPDTATSKEEADKWAKDMGLPAGSVLKASGKDRYYVAIDITPLKNMKDNILDKDSDNYELSNTQYQAWLTGFNAQEDQIKTTVQSLTGRFSNANAVYDNMVKVLSSTISTMAEMSRRYFSI